MKTLYNYNTQPHAIKRIVSIIDSDPYFIECGVIKRKQRIMHLLVLLAYMYLDDEDTKRLLIHLIENTMGFME